jgi:small subunit ribosomal protein S8
MYNDPIADLLTRIRNAASVGHPMVEIPYSKLKEHITRLLLAEGYISRYELRDVSPVKKSIRVILKYDLNGYPVIRRIQRVSRPGLRKYLSSKALPRVLSGAGISIVSTNRGLMTDRAARAANVGGEVLCYVY